MVCNSWAWIVEIGCIVATIRIHVVEVLLSPDMGVEKLEMCESLCPCIEGLKNCKGDS